MSAESQCNCHLFVSPWLLYVSTLSYQFALSAFISLKWMMVFKYICIIRKQYLLLPASKEKGEMEARVLFHLFQCLLLNEKQMPIRNKLIFPDRNYLCSFCFMSYILKILSQFFLQFFLSIARSGRWWWLLLDKSCVVFTRQGGNNTPSEQCCDLGADWRLEWVTIGKRWDRPRLAG